MVIYALKCQMCGHRFDAEVLDDDDPRERHRSGRKVTCPRCRSTEIELVQKVRKTREAP